MHILPHISSPVASVGNPPRGCQNDGLFTDTRAAMNAPVSHADLDATVTHMHLGVTASELHGSLAGYLCGHGDADGASVLDVLQLESDDAHVRDDDHAVLAQLHDQCARGLDDPQLGFQPLLPGEDQTVEERAEALVEWCRGFLGGFGLAGPSAREKLSADSLEIMSDIGTIAASQLTHGDAEEDEQALTEVLEFVRVGALLMRTETGTRESTPGADQPTLH